MVTMFKSTRIFWFLFAYSGLSVRIFGLLFVEISSGAYSVFNCSHIPVLLRIFRFFWPKFFAYSGFTRIFRFPYSFFRIFRFYDFAYSFWLVALNLYSHNIL